MISNRRSIEGFPNYTIASTGEVFNKQDKELHQYVNRDGYSLVTLSNNGKAKTFQVHRLVANAYIDNPYKKQTVNHIDGNKLNNDVCNLEWATHSENEKHAYDNDLRRSYLTYEDRKRGARISGEKRKLSVRVVETGKIYESMKDCANEMECDIGAISKCCNGLANKHHGYHFEFAE